MDLNQFDAFEIHPCTLLNDQGQPADVNYEPCESGDPDLAAYVLYGHTPGQGVTALADFASKDLAEMFRDMLSAKRREMIYAAVSATAQTVQYPITGKSVKSITYYALVVGWGFNDLQRAAQSVVDARHEFNTPHIQLYQLVPVDPASAEPALAAAEKAWAEDDDDNAD